MPPKSKKTQAKKRQAGRRKRVGKAGARNVKDGASLSANRTYTVAGSPPTQPVANVMYALMNTTLSQFDRAVACAKAYQFYRIKNVTMKIKPQFDTYAFGASGYGKPKLYYMFDKSGSVPTNITLEGLKQMGAKPHNLDENPQIISWAPSVLSAVLTDSAALATQAGQYKISPWLTTSSNTVSPLVWNPNNVDHLGVYFYVEATSYGGTGGLPYQIDVEVQFEYKKPLWAAVGSSNAISIVPAVIDASPDGIEGGSDGISIPLSNVVMH